MFFVRKSSKPSPKPRDCKEKLEDLRKRQEEAAARTGERLAELDALHKQIKDADTASRHNRTLMSSSRRLLTVTVGRSSVSGRTTLPCERT